MRAGLGIDAATLKQMLIRHLTSRLDSLDAEISYLERSLFPGWRTVAPEGPWREVVIRLAQIHENYDSEPPEIDYILKLKLKYGPSDAPRWREAVKRLDALDNKPSLFAAFADIEEDFEPLETHVDGLAELIDLEEQRAEEVRRGK